MVVGLLGKYVGGVGCYSVVVEGCLSVWYCVCLVVSIG